MPELASLEPLLAQQGPLILLVLTVMEGPVVTVTAAALAQKGVLDIRLVFALAVLGDLIGDLAVYLAGRFGLGLLPRSLSRRAGLDRLILDPMAKTFAQSGWTLLTAAKWTHVAGLPTLVAAGVARMPVASFLLCSFFATLPKVALFCLLGWSFGLALTDFDLLLWLMLPMGGSAIGLLIFQRRRKDRSCALP